MKRGNKTEGGEEQIISCNDLFLSSIYHILSDKILPHEAKTQLGWPKPVGSTRWHYNQTRTAPPRPSMASHFSTDLAEIWHDCYLGGKDQVYRQNIDLAALQHSMP